jgi:hypothetical protein
MMLGPKAIETDNRCVPVAVEQQAQTSGDTKEVGRARREMMLEGRQFRRLIVRDHPSI